MSVRKYVVKAREREQWVAETVKGPRRVWRWTKWREVSRHGTFQEACVRIQKRGVRLEQLAVFLGGKRVRA